jgi:putative ABC transport system ATP-binding protein
MRSVQLVDNELEHIDSSSSGNSSGNDRYLIELHRVSKYYDTAAGQFVALKGIDLRIDSGEFVSIVGKSGSGKTTLINMLTGIDRPSQGEIYVAGNAIHTLSEGKIATWRGIHMGVVFQFFQLLPMLTVLENVILPMDVCNLFTRAERRDRAVYLLEQVGLADVAHKFPNKLSGGQQQSAAIARALANDPPIIATDEPTGNLDSKGAATVIRMFEGLVAEGKTILMVTHDDELAQRSSRTIRITDGAIVPLS